MGYAICTIRNGTHFYRYFIFIQQFRNGHFRKKQQLRFYSKQYDKNKFYNETLLVILYSVRDYFFGFTETET